MLEWRPVAVAGFLQLAVSLALALLVFVTRPERSQNRWLAAFLLVGGLWHGSVEGLRMVLVDARDVHAIGVALYALLPWLAFAHLGFLGTIEARLARPLRRPAARWALGGAAAALSATALLRADWWYEGLVPWRHVGGLQYDTAILADAFYPALMVIYAFGLVVAWRAYTEAEGPLARRRLRWYLAGFAVHDSLQLAWLYLLVFHVNPKTAGPVVEHVYFVLPAVAALALGVFLTYGILQAQLFDVDLRIKWTLRRGTVGALFVGAFLVGFAVAEQFLQERYGWLLGGLAVGLLLVALRPIERAAARLADAAMPRAQDTEEYRTVRKREVYRATVEGALRDGEISERERDMLASLQDQLALTATEAREIEREAQAARAVSARAGGP